MTKVRKKKLKEIISNHSFELKPKHDIKDDIPLKHGGIRWDIFTSKDYQVKSASMKGQHPFLVIDDENGNIVGLTMTSSDGRSGQRYIEMRNIIRNQNPKSYFEKELRYQNKAKHGKLLTKKALIDKVNKMELSQQEKQEILKVINYIESNKVHYQEFVDKSKK